MTQCDAAAPLQTPAQSNLGGWVLLGVAVAIVVYEVWALRTGRPTISQWVRRRSQHRWWKPFGVAAIAVILWHLFEGGPL